MPDRLYSLEYSRSSGYIIYHWKQAVSLHYIDNEFFICVRGTGISYLKKLDRPKVDLYFERFRIVQNSIPAKSYIVKIVL